MKVVSIKKYLLVLFEIDTFVYFFSNILFFMAALV